MNGTVFERFNLGARGGISFGEALLSLRGTCGFTSTRKTRSGKLTNSVFDRKSESHVTK